MAEIAINRVFINRNNAFVVSLVHDDGTFFDLAFDAHSDGYHQLVHTLAQAATRRLSQIGERGVVIVGTTAVPEDE
jgi:hypothetical protein